MFLKHVSYEKKSRVPFLLLGPELSWRVSFLTHHSWICTFSRIRKKLSMFLSSPGPVSIEFPDVHPNYVGKRWRHFFFNLMFSRPSAGRRGRWLWLFLEHPVTAAAAAAAASVSSRAVPAGAAAKVQQSRHNRGTLKSFNNLIYLLREIKRGDLYCCIPAPRSKWLESCWTMRKRPAPGWGRRWSDRSGRKKAR